MLNLLSVETDDILEQKFVNKKQQEDAVLEQIKKEYNFDEIKVDFYEVAVPRQLDFSMVRKIVILTRSLNFYRQAMKIENLENRK